MILMHIITVTEIRGNSMDYGLLGGIGEGLRSGVESYRTERDYQQKKKIQEQQALQQKQLQEMAMQEKGFLPDEEGNLQRTAYGQLEEQNKQTAAEKLAHENDPNHPESIALRQRTNKILSSIDPKLKDLIPDNASATAIKSDPFLGKVISGEYGMLGKKYMVDAANDRFKQNLNFKTEGLEEKRNKNASQAGDDFENRLKTFKTTQNSLYRAKSLLDGDAPVTARTFAVANNDFINAVAQGGAATEGKIQREMPETYIQKVNELKEKFGNIEDLRKVPAAAALLKQLHDQMDQVYQDVSRAAGDQALDVHDSYSANSNPKVQATVREKLKRYAPDHYQRLYGGEDAPKGLITGSGLTRESTPSQPGQAKGLIEPQGQQKPSQEDLMAISWARQNPKDPRSALILKKNNLSN